MQVVNRITTVPDEGTAARDFSTWKYMTCSHGAWFFVQLAGSDCILAVNQISIEDCYCYGVFQIRGKTGKSYSGQPINFKHARIETIWAASQIDYNTAVLPSDKSVESRASVLLNSMVTSGEYSRMTNKELVVKAVQLAIDFNQAIQSLGGK